MPTPPLTIPITHDFLAEPLRAGEPAVVGPLAVFPLFGPAPELPYVSFAQAQPAGVSVKELDGGASVNDLMVNNPGQTNVLLYEGEEVLGAQQNRTFDVTVLVPARSRLRVPVSCVEHGRWDGARHDESFAPAPQAAYPELRRMKNRQARVAASAGLEARAHQGEVWEAVAAKSARMSVASGTGAMHDIYEGRRDHLDAFRDAIVLQDGQIGALVAYNGKPTVLDHVSRPEVFAALHGPLVQGYALDALEHVSVEQAAPPNLETVEEFIDAVLGARVSERDGIGMGREIRFTDRTVGGAGLVVANELVQLTAFAEDQDGPSTPGPVLRSRINRPSRRRSA